MINSTYNPESITDFEKSKLNFAGKSVMGTSNASETTTIDLVLVDDHLLTGGLLIVKNGKMPDMVTLQIVHPAYGVVNEFVTKYRVIEDSNKQFELVLEYPARLFAGLSIRCKYESSADIGERTIAVNYFLHKVLI